jgi:hypothetical protein
MATVPGARNVSVSAPVHERLMAIKADMSKDKGRTVSLSEVLEVLLDTWAEVTG